MLSTAKLKMAYWHGIDYLESIMMEWKQPAIDSTHSLFESQKTTAQQWRRSSLQERIDRIAKIRSWVKQNQKEIRLALWNDFQKSEVETDLSEIYPITTEINHTIKNLKSWMKPKAVPTPLAMMGTKAFVHAEPKGRTLIISPWNYPFNLAIGPLISALAAGCTAIIKPSEMTPHTSGLIEKMILDLFETSEVAVVQGDAKTSQELLELPFDHIFFTGSPQVGKIIMGEAAKNLSSVTLELGGKSPTLIGPSADIKDAASKIIYGKLINCGQTCVAPDYLLVHESIKDRLLDELKIAIQQQFDPDYKGIENSKDLTKVVNDKHFRRLDNLLENALNLGAKLEFGGKRIPNHRFFEPTLLSLITESMDLAHEEIFGPILPILSYTDLDQAIDYINSKPKPLALYIFSQDKEETNLVLEETSSGNVVINDCVLHFMHQELPFGGVNTSGIGKSHGYYGFLAFSNEKGVLKQRIGFNNASLLRPPYGTKTKQIINSLIKWF